MHWRDIVLLSYLVRFLAMLFIVMIPTHSVLAAVPGVVAGTQITHTNITGKVCQDGNTTGSKQWAQINWKMTIGENTGVQRVGYAVTVTAGSNDQNLVGEFTEEMSLDSTSFPNPAGSGKYARLGFRGRVTSGSMNLNEPVAIYSTQYREERGLTAVAGGGYQEFKDITFTLIDTKVLDRPQTQKYKITPFVYYSVNTTPFAPGGLDPSLGRLPSFEVTINPASPASCQAPKQAADYSNSIFSVSGETIEIAVEPNRPADHIGAQIKLGGNKNTKVPRPELTFTLKHVVKTGTRISVDRNLLYFVGPNEYPEIAILITDEPISQTKGIVAYNNIRDERDDQDVGVRLIFKGSTLRANPFGSAGFQSFITNVINIYYHKLGADGHCVEGQYGGYSENLAESKCISGERLRADDINVNDSDFISPSGVVSKGDCPIKISLVGDALCAVADLVMSVAIYVADISFRLLLQATTLQ